MFDYRPENLLLLLPAAEKEAESFEARVLRELTAIGERLAKLEAEIARQHPWVAPVDLRPYVVPPMTPGVPPLSVYETVINGGSFGGDALARIQNLPVADKPLCAFTDLGEMATEYNRRVGSDGKGLWKQSDSVLKSQFDPPNLGLKPLTIENINRDFDRVFGGAPAECNEIGEIIG